MIRNRKSKCFKPLKHKEDHFITKNINKDQRIISRIVISERFKILLPEYDDLEIELTPLPKAFYIFMLRYSDGIRFKELSMYREELIEIYKHVGNRTDMDQIKKSIADLTDSRSNSVNEKCSRIKNAFLLHLEDSIAQNYYITGARSEPKLIKLQTNLIHFPKNL